MKLFQVHRKTSYADAELIIVDSVGYVDLLVSQPDIRWRHPRLERIARGYNDGSSVPTYDEVEKKVEEEAFATFRKLLPAWTIVGIESSALMVNSGALHCATMNRNRSRKSDHGLDR